MTDIVCDLDVQADPYPVDCPASCPVVNRHSAFLSTLEPAYEHARR